MSELFVLLVLLIFSCALVAVVGLVIVLIRGGSFSGRLNVEKSGFSADIEAEHLPAAKHDEKSHYDEAGKVADSGRIISAKDLKTPSPPVRKSAA